MAEEGVKELELFEQRLASAQKWRELGANPWGNGFRPEHLAGEILFANADQTVETLEATPKIFSVAGRIVALRPFKNAAFIVIQDRSGAIQVHLKQDKLGDRYELFKLCDLGDFVGIVGQLFRTRTGELTLAATRFEPLTKTLRAPPGKFAKSEAGQEFAEKNAMADTEQRYRQRYLDLLANADVRATFVKRSKLVQFIRRFLDARGYLEVETPMMHSLVSGAAARPFRTHHNTLNLDLYMRIAPELHLKRLVVGGFDRVYEINRNFRNEGISTRHNPEFTMLEFYEAYATYEDLIALTEEMLAEAAQAVAGSTTIKYGEHTLQFGRGWKRIPMWEAIREKVPSLTDKDRADTDKLRAVALEGVHGPERKGLEGMNRGELIGALFEKHVEDTLIQPTFVTHFPTEISPLARRNDDDPTVTDRFELIVAQREIANAFSELNDPIDQKGRFQSQVEAKGRGQEETMDFDEDYIRALEHGLPPTAGEGIGIDRLAMLFTDSPSIRDVILFPLLKPQAK
ncbi:MAG: Lysyl-tRNA synthetase [Myxococcaceae bacterium]|nr:Lysyl-tRNA synthetase [Myxococcaceae bacterium]